MPHYEIGWSWLMIWVSPCTLGLEYHCIISIHTTILQRGSNTVYRTSMMARTIIGTDKGLFHLISMGRDPSDLSFGEASNVSSIDFNCSNF